MNKLKQALEKAVSDLTDAEKQLIRDNSEKLTNEQTEKFAEILADGAEGAGEGEGEGAGEGKEGEGEGEGEQADEQAMKALISQTMNPLVKKYMEEASNKLVAKFFDGVAEHRKRAIDTGKKPQDKGHESTRDFMKALFAGDRQYLKAAGDYLNTSDNETAGYLVPPQLMAEVLRIATVYGVARRDMRYLPFSGPGNSRTIPALSTSVTVNWTEEGAKKNSTQPEFALVTQTLKKLTAIVPMTDEILEDSAVNLTQLVGELIAEAMAKEEDIQFFTGTGSPWTGILNNSNVNVVDMETSDMDDFSADDLLDLIDATPTGALKGSKFYLSRSALSRIRKMKAATTGEYIFQSPGQSLPGQIWDFPYEVMDAMPAIADVSATDPFIIFGNLKQAAIFGDKQQVRVKLLDQAVISSVGHDGDDDINLAEQDMTALRFVERVGYVLALPKAVSVLKLGSGS